MKMKNNSREKFNGSNFFFFIKHSRFSGRKMLVSNSIIWLDKFDRKVCLMWENQFVMKKTWKDCPNLDWWRMCSNFRLSRGGLRQHRPETIMLLYLSRPLWVEPYFKANISLKLFYYWSQHAFTLHYRSNNGF